MNAFCRLPAHARRLQVGAFCAAVALAEIAPSPVVALSRAVALAMIEGLAAGLAELDRLRGWPGINSYYLLNATYGTFWRQAGDMPRAAARYRRALSLAGSAPEQRFLQRKLGECARRVTVEKTA